MNDWVAIEIYHERYTFNTDVVYHVNKTLEEVCNYHGFNYSELKKEDDKKIEKISCADHVGIDLSEAVCNKLNEVIDIVNKLQKPGD